MHKLLKLYNKVNQFGRMMNMELEVVRPGEIIYTMPISEQHLSNPYAAHGGAVAALMDAVLGVAALSLAVENDNLVSTVEFKINYFRPVKPGDVLVGHGKVDFAGNRLISVSGEIEHAESREMLAKGNGTFNQYPAHKLNFDNAPENQDSDLPRGGGT